MGRKKVKSLALFILMMFVASMFSQVFADSLEESKQKAKEADAAKKKAYDSKVKADTQANQDKTGLENIKAQINQVMAAKKKNDEEVNNVQGEIDEIEKVQQQKKQELQQAQKAEDEKQELLEQRARTMYEDGNTTYMEVLLSSKSFSELLSRVDIIKEIVNYDKGIVKDLQEEKDRIAAAKQEIDQQKRNQEAKKQELVQKQKEGENLIKTLSVEQQNFQQQYQDSLQQSQEAGKLYNQKVEAAKIAEEELKRKQDEGRAAGLQQGGQSNRAYNGEKFLWPAPGYTTITDPFGMRVHPITKVRKLHTGTDIGAPYGASVLAAADGTVTVAGWNDAYGNYIMINHGSGYVTLYAHNSKLLVRVGQEVKRGDVISKVGATGYATGAHLHFEVIINGNPVDPMQYFR